jgi:hypothetical protein
VDDFGPNEIGVADRVEGHTRDPRLIFEEREKDMLSSNHILPVLLGNYVRALQGAPPPWCQRRKAGTLAHGP